MRFTNPDSRITLQQEQRPQAGRSPDGIPLCSEKPISGRISTLRLPDSRTCHGQFVSGSVRSTHVSRTHSSRRHSSWHVRSRFQRSSSSFCLCECHFLRWSSVRYLRRRLGSASNNDPRLLFLAVQARRPSPPRGAHRSGHTDALALSAAQQIPVPSTGRTYWCPGGLLSDRPASCLSRPSVGGTSTDAGFGLIRSRSEYCGLVSQGNPLRDTRGLRCRAHSLRDEISAGHDVETINARAAAGLLYAAARSRLWNFICAGRPDCRPAQME